MCPKFTNLLRFLWCVGPGGADRYSQSIMWNTKSKTRETDPGSGRSPSWHTTLFSFCRSDQSSANLGVKGTLHSQESRPVHPVMRRIKPWDSSSDSYPVTRWSEEWRGCQDSSGKKPRTNSNQLRSAEHKQAIPQSRGFPGGEELPDRPSPLNTSGSLMRSTLCCGACDVRHIWLA